MSFVIATTYRGHTIEPLVYPHFAPHLKGSPRERRYLAAVTVTHLETQATQLARLPRDYSFFGDARRAAEEHGRHLVDEPAADTAPAPAGYARVADGRVADGRVTDPRARAGDPFNFDDYNFDTSRQPPVGNPFSSLEASQPPRAGSPFSGGIGKAAAPLAGLSALDAAGGEPFSSGYASKGLARKEPAQAAGKAPETVRAGEAPDGQAQGKADEKGGEQPVAQTDGKADGQAANTPDPAANVLSFAPLRRPVP
jgi:hypothetical protein